MFSINHIATTQEKKYLQITKIKQSPKRTSQSVT